MNEMRWRLRSERASVTDVDILRREDEYVIAYAFGKTGGRALFVN